MQSHREASARHYAAVKRDPKRYAEFLETKRLEYRLRLERAGRPSPVIPPARYPDPSKWWRVPAGPLRHPIASWLLESGATVDTLARNAGLDWMLIYRILDGSKDAVLVDTADRLLTAIGLHLDNVYDEVPARGTRASVIAHE